MSKHVRRILKMNRPCVKYTTPNSLGVVEKAAAGLAAQTARGNTFPQKRTRRVLVVAEALVQHAHDRDARVQADEIGECERPDRVVEAELRDRVDRVGLGDPVVERPDRLVDEGHEDAVRDEAWEVRGFGRRLLELARAGDD